MSTLSEAYSIFQVAREKYSEQTKAFIRLRNTLPPDGARSVEEELLWQQLRREYALASKEFKRAERAFTSLAAKQPPTSLLDSNSNFPAAGLSLEVAVQEAKREKNLDIIQADPMLSKIAEAALKHMHGQPIQLSSEEEEAKAAREMEEFGTF